LLGLQVGFAIFFKKNQKKSKSLGKNGKKKAPAGANPPLTAGG